MKNIILLFLFVTLTACSKNKYETCVTKGIQYYKDIGSYPRLKSENTLAEDKVRDSCKRSIVAFD